MRPRAAGKEATLCLCPCERLRRARLARVLSACGSRVAARTAGGGGRCTPAPPATRALPRHLFRFAAGAAPSPSSAAHDNWQRLANLNSVVYDVGTDYSFTYAGTVSSFTSGALSVVSFIPSLAELPLPPNPPPPPPPVPSPLPPAQPDDGSGVGRCTTPVAINYNPSATNTFEGACEYKVVKGCTDSTKGGYIPTAAEERSRHGWLRRTGRMTRIRTRHAFWRTFGRGVFDRSG